MQILSLTIIVFSLILLGAIAGIYVQGKIDALHQHVESVHNELKVQAAVLHTKIIYLERGIDDARNDVKTISERDEVTDPGFTWNKQISRQCSIDSRPQGTQRYPSQEREKPCCDKGWCDCS